MAKADWSHWYYPSYPGRFYHEDSTVICSAGAQDSFSHRWEQRDGSAGAWIGYTNNGTAILDGSISCQIRAEGNMALQAQALGVILRKPTNQTGLIAATDRDFYTAGLYFDATDTTVNMRLYRWLDGVGTLIGSPWTCPIVADQFIQFEIQLENDGNNDVIIRRRQNEGTSMTDPGGAGWTAFTTIATDTGHAGILNQAGYWGWGWGNYSGFSGGTNNVYYDRVILTEGV